MAPELLDPEKFGKKHSRPTKPGDMYAFGMVVYEVLTGLDPFNHKKDVPIFSLIRLIVNGERPAKPRNAEEIGLGSQTWKLVKECWRSDSKKRPAVEQALMHMGDAVLPPGDFRSPSPDPQQTTFREWRRLASQSSKSANYKQIATKLVDDEKNRKIALNFRGEDAAIVLDTLDKVSRSRHLMSTAAHRIYPSTCLEDGKG